MKLLNVVAYAVAGSLGLSFLLQTLHRLSLAQQMEEAAPPSGGTDESVTPVPGALEHDPAWAIDPRVKLIFRVWVVVFGLVGAQMSWVLRPFIGNPSMPVEFLRADAFHGNFYETLFRSSVQLFN